MFVYPAVLFHNRDHTSKSEFQPQKKSRIRMLCVQLRMYIILIDALFSKYFLVDKPSLRYVYVQNEILMNVKFHPRTEFLYPHG